MKRTVSILLISLLMAALAACGGGSSDSGSSDTGNRTSGASHTPEYRGSTGSTSVEAVPGTLTVESMMNREELAGKLPEGVEITEEFAPGNVKLSVPFGREAETAEQLRRIQGVFEVAREHKMKTSTLYDYSTELKIKGTLSELQGESSGSSGTSRSASFETSDPASLDLQILPGDPPSDPQQDATQPGQDVWLQPAGWKEALDYSFQASGNVGSRQVTVAIIDAGIFLTPQDSVDPDDQDGDGDCDEPNEGPDCLPDRFVHAEIPYDDSNEAPSNINAQMSAEVDGSSDPADITQGLDNVRFETWDHDNDPGTSEIPIRNDGHRIYGALDAMIDGPNLVLTTSRGANPDEFDAGEDLLWGAAGLLGDFFNSSQGGPSNTNGTEYVIIKTGREAGTGEWEITESDLAASIDYAVNQAGADIVATGYTARLDDETDPPSSELENAISNARSNGALVIAPTGGNPQTDSAENDFFQDPDGTPDSGDENFTYADNSQTQDLFIPAKVDGVLSTAAIGSNTPIEQQGIFTLGAPFDDGSRQPASWNSAVADIFAPGRNVGIGNSANSINTFGVGTHVPVAVTTATAAYAYQAIINRKAGTRPDDIDSMAETAITSSALSVSRQNLPDLRILSMPTAISSALTDQFSSGGGGQAFEVTQLEFSNTPGSSASFDGSNRTRADIRTPFGMRFDIDGGTAPYEARVEWFPTSTGSVQSCDFDDRSDPANCPTGFTTEDGLGNTIGQQDNTFALTADQSNLDFEGDGDRDTGYPVAGQYSGTIFVRDDDGNVVQQGFTVQASEKLGASIEIIDSGGNLITPNESGETILQTGESYTFRAVVDNVLGRAGTEVQVDWTIDQQQISDQQTVDRLFNQTGQDIQAQIEVTEGNRAPGQSTREFDVQ